MLMWLLLRVSMVVVRVLPLRVSYVLARAGGSVWFWIDGGRRRRSIENMLLVTRGKSVV